MDSVAKKKKKHSFISLLLYSALTGLVVGLVLYGFKRASVWLVEKMLYIYEYVQNHLLLIPLLFAGLILMALTVSYIIKKEPNAGSGAIPRAEGFLRGLISFQWFKTTVATILSSFLVFFGGLPYGIEGPSVITGTSVAGGVKSLTKADDSLNRYILTSGASAGFAIASGSALAGVVFSLEEMHKRFSFLLLMVSMTGAVFASLTIKLLDNLFNTGSIFFPIGYVETLPLNHLWLTVILGIVAGAAASLYNIILEKVGHFSDGKLKHVSQKIKLIINFVLVGIAGLIVIETLGNGHELIIESMSRHYLWTSLLVFLILKVILITVSIGSGVTGGLFVPSLVVGALIGALINELLIGFGFPGDYTKIIILLSMGAFFATTISAPITTVVFMIEATLDPTNVLAMIMTILVSMAIAHILKVESINDIVLNRMLKKKNSGKEYYIYELTGQVIPNSFVDQETVRDILWPASTIITTMRRIGDNNHHRMVKNGDKKLKAHDVVVIQAQTYDLNQTIDELYALMGEQNFTIKLLH
ncbi:MAG: ClC family H(+)/Cl(-) exchange transporter [Acholeplasma sp.]|nr:ClC family H(+)/Cl(-) exchange transporter [Acholeplasma sp.]